MKHLILASLVVFLLVLAADLAIGQTRGPVRYVPNELLVKFAPGVKKATASKTMQFAGANVLETLGDLGWVRVQLPAGTALKRAVASYAQLPDVIAAQPNYYYELQNTPNDPF